MIYVSSFWCINVKNFENKSVTVLKLLFNTPVRSLLSLVKVTYRRSTITPYSLRRFPSFLLPYLRPVRSGWHRWPWVHGLVLTPKDWMGSTRLRFKVKGKRDKKSQYCKEGARGTKWSRRYVEACRVEGSKGIRGLSSTLCQEKICKDFRRCTSTESRDVLFKSSDFSNKSHLTHFCLVSVFESLFRSPFYSLTSYDLYIHLDI